MAPKEYEGSELQRKNTWVASVLALASVACFAAATESKAQDNILALIQKWKLAGRWATDCSPEANPNGVVEYDIDANGRASISNGQSVTEMRISSINQDGDLTLHTVRSGSEETRVLTLRRIDDTLQPTISRPERLDYAVRGNKFVASLKETARLRYCQS